MAEADIESYKVMIRFHETMAKTEELMKKQMDVIVEASKKNQSLLNERIMPQVKKWEAELKAEQITPKDFVTKLKSLDVVVTESGYEFHPKDINYDAILESTAFTQESIKQAQESLEKAFPKNSNLAFPMSSKMKSIVSNEDQL